MGWKAYADCGYCGGKGRKYKAGGWVRCWACARREKAAIEAQAVSQNRLTLKDWIDEWNKPAAERDESRLGKLAANLLKEGVSVRGMAARAGVTTGEVDRVLSGQLSLLSGLREEERRAIERLR